MLYKNDTHEHAKLNGDKPMGLQPYTKSYRQLKETGIRRGSLPQGSAHQMVLHCQMISPANSNIVQTLWAIFRTIYDLYIYARNNNNEKSGLECEGEQGRKYGKIW